MSDGIKKAMEIINKPSARETKAQRREREAAEMAAYNAEMESTYHHRLMAILERATNANFNITVKDGAFVLEDNDLSEALVTLPNVYSLDANSKLQDLEWVIRVKEDRKREAERKYQVRQAALGKLTKEERDVLGL